MTRSLSNLRVYKIGARSVQGATITLDAMGTHKRIAKKILEKNADYVLALKANQGTLYDAVSDLFAYAHANDFKRIIYDYYEDINKDHGRIETRRYWFFCLHQTMLLSVGLA